MKIYHPDLFIVKAQAICPFAALTLFFLKNYNLGSKLWQLIPHIIRTIKNEKGLMAFWKG
jgi:hypothetical protein